MHDHFRGKEAMEHIVEVQANGKVSSSEIHGAETPGYLFAATDAARETTMALLLLCLLLSFFEFLPDQLLALLVSFSVAWACWKFGRASWLAWSRLERLHRVMDEERYEIEHNRSQEKEELKVLYRAKGFQGKLLDDVIDVLMADGDRALRVMLEEELGFRLEENEHPLLQGLGAFLGAMGAACVLVLAYMVASYVALLTVSVGIFSLSSYLTAKREHNKSIPAIIWNLGIALFAFGVAHFSMKFLGSD